MLNNHRESPLKSILDPSFRYTKSIETDIRKTFARVRREEAKKAPAAPIAPPNVLPWRGIK